MIQKNTIYIFVFAVFATIFINGVQSATEAEQKAQKNAETMALTRDGMYRENPDELLAGFFAAWPAVMYILAGAFFVIALLSFFGYVTGICKGRNIQFHAVGQ